MKVPEGYSKAVVRVNARVEIKTVKGKGTGKGNWERQTNK